MRIAKSQGHKSHSKSQNRQAKILNIKRHTHVYNNCYELRSKAIKNCCTQDSKTAKTDLFTLNLGLTAVSAHYSLEIILKPAEVLYCNLTPAEIDQFISQAQSHGRRKKTDHQYNPNFLDCKKDKSAIIVGL